MSNSVLIIDDNAGVLENVKELLELAGYGVFSACNGKEGLTLAKIHKPDLILCDVMMPELDGYGVLRAIENISELAGTPFVFMTAKVEQSDFRKGMDMGADDYLAKPFSGDDLLKVVDARLKKMKSIKKSFANKINLIPEYIDSAKIEGDITILLSNHRIVKKIKKKDMVFLEGETPSFLYYVASGKVKIFRTNDSGKDYITEIQKEGTFFGYISLLEDTNHKESAMAMENSEIYLIPKQDFFHLLYSNREVAMQFIKFISVSLSEAEEKLLKLAYNSARKRVAEALLFVSKKYQVDGKNNMSFALLRENISALAGISPESVSRNLADFKDEGLIETDYRNIKILDINKLEKIRN
jgi:CRP/FNR family transcriptional regulator, polysaccharide utilization system transcription regulator